MTVNRETPFKLHAIDLCSRRIRNNRSGCQHLTELKILIVIMVDRQIGHEGSVEPARLQAGFIAPDRFGPEGRRDSAHGKATTLEALLHRGINLLVPAEFVTRRSEEHTSELQSLMRISYAVFCLK